MDEIDFENHFYENDLQELLASQLFLNVDRRKCRFLVEQGTSSSPCRVLSLGCGDGRKETGIAAHASEILGVDISPVAVRQARLRAEGLKLGHVKFIRDDVRTMDQQAATFDLIIAIGIFHHFEDATIDQVLRRSLNWLKPGGVLITNDPQDARFVGLFRRMFKSKYHKYHSEHEHELNIRKMRGHFLDAGFGSVDVKYTDFFLDPLAWLFPKFPRALTGCAEAVDSVLLAIPGFRRFASHFSIVAHK